MVGDEAPAPVWMDMASETIRVWLRLPEGYKFLPDGAHQVTVSSSDERVVRVPPFALIRSAQWRRTGYGWRCHAPPRRGPPPSRRHKGRAG